MTNELKERLEALTERYVTADKQRRQQGTHANDVRLSAARNDLKGVVFSAYRSGDLITRQEMEEAVAEAVAKEREAVSQLVDASQWARNRLEKIADDSWHGDGRDLKRSLVGVFADFDDALKKCNSEMPEHFRARSEQKEGE